MVDLALLQSVSYIAGALGVCVAAIYYVINLRINQRTMRLNLTNNYLQRLLTDEFMNKIVELQYMQWKDYDDFEKKYGSDEHPENFGKRMIVFGVLDSLGMLLKLGLADKEILYGSQLVNTGTFFWYKFKDVLEENRRLYSGADAWSGLEYLAEEMASLRRLRDPNFRADMGDPRYDEAKKRIATS